MGCKNSKIDTKFNDNIVISNESQEGIRAVQETWLSIKKIENLGPKTAAHLIRSYPTMRKLMNISSSLKTETELLRLNEVRELGNMLLAVYNDLIKHAETNLDEKIRSKATVLAKQTFDPQLIKYFGSSFYYMATHQMDIKLTRHEKDSWAYFIQYVSNQLTNEMNASRGHL